MKSFFEEYGFVILAAIVVILLIAMASPIGDLVKAQITGIVDSFANKTESKLNAVDAGTITVRATTSGGNVYLEWDAEKAEDEFKYQVRKTVDSSEAQWEPKADAARIGDTDGKKDSKQRKISITGLANGNKVEYKIYDSNGAVVASGTVVARN